MLASGRDNARVGTSSKFEGPSLMLSFHPRHSACRGRFSACRQVQSLCLMLVFGGDGVGADASSFSQIKKSGILIFFQQFELLCMMVSSWAVC